MGLKLVIKFVYILQFLPTLLLEQIHLYKDKYIYKAP